MVYNNIQDDSIDAMTSPALLPIDSRASNEFIVDIGMHDGKDSIYYASRGFKVIAFEANPVLCSLVSAQISSSSCPIEIRNAAISDIDGYLDFYVNSFNSTWSSLDPALGSRKGGHSLVKVRSCNLEKELAEVENIVYAKIDIEGYDVIALRQLMSLKRKPLYISVENGSQEMLSILKASGYEQFKLSNQKYVKFQKVPENSPHGNAVDYQFATSSSGLWGEDIEGRWFSYQEMSVLIDALTAARSLALNNLFAEAVGWFDLHATIRSPS